MDRLLAKYATRLLKLGVDEIEIKVGREGEREGGRRKKKEEMILLRLYNCQF